eukprot:1136612-Pelagomonas_calceolata.AAC.3
MRPGKLPCGRMGKHAEVWRSEKRASFNLDVLSHKIHQDGQAALWDDGQACRNLGVRGVGNNPIIRNLAIRDIRLAGCPVDNGMACRDLGVREAGDTVKMNC